MAMSKKCKAHNPYGVRVKYVKNTPTKNCVGVNKRSNGKKKTYGVGTLETTDRILSEVSHAINYTVYIQDGEVFLESRCQHGSNGTIKPLKAKLAWLDMGILIDDCLLGDRLIEIEVYKGKEVKLIQWNIDQLCSYLVTQRINILKSVRSAINRFYPDSYE